jgi:glycosyltransferase involved in cell wall biosynthesis
MKDLATVTKRTANAPREVLGGKRILLLSTSLLVDRVFLHTELIDALATANKVSVWATSFGEGGDDAGWSGVNADVEPFPGVRAFREYPHNYLRRLNEYVWDYRFPLPSRVSMLKHVRDKQTRLRIRALKGPAKLLAGLGTQGFLENNLERLLLAYPRSPEAEQRLMRDRPDVIVTTGPFQFEQPAIFAAAKKLNIPTLAYIPSWDNVTTKNRMVFKYDGYIVWNKRTKIDLHRFYPETRGLPVYVVGAPQFDIFRQERIFQSREDFCRGQELDPSLPLIVYAIGSPNFLKEHYGPIYLAKRIAEGHLGDVQMLVRPHPIHDNAEMRELFERFGPRVRLQTTPNAGKDLTRRSQDETQIREWVNTFRHADVVVNLSSTVTIDAAIFDKPVVNLDFDPQPGSADQELIKDINHMWNHFKPIAESGGVWLVNDFEEMENAVAGYLKQPELHREKRKWLAEYVCEHLDGENGRRFADAVVDFARFRSNSAASARATQ